MEIFIGKHLQEMKKNKNLAEVIHIELRQTNKLVRDYRKNSFSNYLNIVSSIIEEGKQKNIFRQDVQPDIAKQILFGALDEISRIWGSGNEMGMDFSVEDVTEQLTAIFQQGVLETDHES